MLMNLKKLFMKFKKQIFSKNEINQKGMYQEVGTMENPILHPVDFLEELMFAIANQEKKTVSALSTNVKLYNMFDIDTGEFIGSFYALLKNGIYYGNIVGNKEIIACKPQSFRLEETNELFVPCRIILDNIYALICDYHAESGTLKPLRFIETDKQKKDRETIHEFKNGEDIEYALQYCADIFQ